MKLFFYCALLAIVIQLLKICFFILDLSFFGFERKRNDVARQLNLSMNNSKDRMIINRYIMKQDIGVISFYLLIAVMIYLLFW